MTLRSLEHRVTAAYHPSMTGTPYVLFVCQHGSAKSVIAATHFRRLAGEQQLRLQAATAGLEPDDEIPPIVMAGLLMDGFEVSEQRPRRVTAREIAAAQCVVSFGCDLADLARPATRVERWDDLPLVSDGYASARDAIVHRLRDLIRELSHD
jgi:arsenate reductase (thioredoxin)